MKKINYFIWAISCSCLLIISCTKDNEFLEEKRLDALNIDNAYLNRAQFAQLAASMYRSVQRFYNSSDGPKDSWVLGLGTDILMDPRGDAAKYNDWNLVNPFDNFSGDWFNWQFDIINIANTLIDKANAPGVKWNSDVEKNAVLAEGRFFRGFAYRNLANIFGGVPIVDKSVSEPKVDFKRSTRDEVWQFAKADLEFAKTHLPITTTQPGRVVRAASDHLLAELNISLKDYDGAIAAATRVLDGTDGSYQLMTGRFGTRATEAGKDIYWDLYRMGNQNYQEGNKEAIWVAQFEDLITGGTVNFNRPLIERMMWPIHWFYTTHDGTQKDSTGRGVAFVRPTSYMNYTVWENMGNDLRGNEVNIKRKYYFGKNTSISGVTYPVGTLIKYEYFANPIDTMQRIYPTFSKFGTDKHIGGRPDNGYIRDFYIMRLSETYLLRAEAYLGKGLKDKAADDINVVRNRAKAPLITAADVTIDYILDERARELFGDELRMLTLGRLGLIYDRAKKYGYTPVVNSIQPYNNLMPIPQTAIDRNVGLKLEQNPGY